MRDAVTVGAVADKGWFDAKLAPIAGVTADEAVRRDTSLAKLAALATTTSRWAAAHGPRPRYGLQVVCEGGGMANATILELR